MVNLFKTVILILLCFYNTTIKAQEKHIFLQIDTVKLHEKKESYKNKPCQIRFGMEYDYMDKHYYLSYFRTPAYTNEIVVYGNTTKLFLPIDCNQGYISISNIYSIYSDTLKIKKLELFSTETLDTITNTISKYKLTNGKLESYPKNIKKKVTINEPISPPNPIKLIINEEEYYVDIFLIDDGVMIVSNGHTKKPKNHLNKKGNYKKRTKHINFSIDRKYTYWFGELKL